VQKKQVKESIKSQFVRLLFNLFPCYRRTGVRVTYIASDFQEVRIKLPLNWKTRGYNGTIFGGSMYASIDPVYMTMISWNLGRNYVVWDKSATMDFLKPGKETLFATFSLRDGQIDDIRADLKVLPRVERHYHVELCDKGGVVHARFEKTIVAKHRSSAPKQGPLIRNPS
jgi:acyl-coenzyme A thioesterase PaaI-like protein